jgi:hypothetical protein
MVKATSSIGPLRPISTTSATDPIYAAIERHRIAEREYGDVLTAQGKLEMELPKELQQSNIDVSGEHIVETDDPRWIAIEHLSWGACEKTVECSSGLMEIRPTTLEGLKALLRYVTDFLGDDADVSRGILANATKAFETVWPGEPVEETESGETESGVSEFGDAYAEWLDARAGVAKMDAKGYAAADDPDPDAVADQMMARLRMAEHRLAFMPAILPYQMIEKFETLEAMISQRERDGYPNDNRHMLMLSSVKADLYRFRLERKQV